MDAPQTVVVQNAEPHRCHGERRHLGVPVEDERTYMSGKSSLSNAILSNAILSNAFLSAKNYRIQLIVRYN